MSVQAQGRQGVAKRGDIADYRPPAFRRHALVGGHTIGGPDGVAQEEPCYPEESDPDSYNPVAQRKENCTHHWNQPDQQR